MVDPSWLFIAPSGVRHVSAAIEAWRVGDLGGERVKTMDGAGGAVSGTVMDIVGRRDPALGEVVREGRGVLS